MAPRSTMIQGLNVVQPVQPSSGLTDAQDLLSGSHFPDLAAQLDLWTNLSFASDEPFISDRRPVDDSVSVSDDLGGVGDDSGSGLYDDDEERGLGDKLSPDAIVAQEGSHSFDLGSFLAGFSTDPFLVSPTGLNPHTFHPSDLTGQNKADIARGAENDTSPPSKRSRTRKASTSTSQSYSRKSSEVNDSDSVFPDAEPNLTTPLTAAEDKRRRNTAASARFRMKKKEREIATEKRCKELEGRVGELERECEGLRRENGWLKGLVVGVTGGNPSSVPVMPVSGVGGGSTAQKRKRDDVVVEEEKKTVEAVSL
jgi:hypothetical protein